MLRRLVCIACGLGMCLVGALWFSTGQAAHAAFGVLLFAAGAAGVGLEGWPRSSGCGAAKGRSEG
jgi:hypothetical protein